VHIFSFATSAVVPGVNGALGVRAVKVVLEAKEFAAEPIHALVQYKTSQWFAEKILDSQNGDHGQHVRKPAEEERNSGPELIFVEWDYQKHKTGMFGYSSDSIK